MAARLGRYEVLKHLASGGMADVLLGRTDGIEGFERHVVLKRIKPEHAQDLRFIRMLLEEARVAANLHHQHIVQVHDIGETAGEYFIAMEYLHGEDVRTILLTASRSRQHVPLGYAMAIVSAAAAGLHYAHERRGPDKRPLGIVHRDVSPSNILVCYDGSIKIVDFGIAKASARQETRSSNLKGKISYMSPEQCKSAEIDRRSDVYSLGIVLYELATTTRLFKGTNDYLVMDQIVNGRVPLPQTRRPDLPAELSAVIMRAIAPDPERRFPTADELRRAVDHVADRLGLTASSSAIAAYMRQQFGEKPEPWLELAAPLLGPRGGLASAGSQPGGWTELWRNDALFSASGSAHTGGPPLGSGLVPRASGPIGTGVGASASTPGDELRAAVGGAVNRPASPDDAGSEPPLWIPEPHEPAGEGGDPPALLDETTADGKTSPRWHEPHEPAVEGENPLASLDEGGGEAPLWINPREPARGGVNRPASPPRPARRPSTAPTEEQIAWESPWTAPAGTSVQSVIAAAIAVPVFVSIGFAIWWFARTEALPARAIHVKRVEEIPAIEEVTKLAGPAAEPEPPAEAAASQAHSPETAPGRAHPELAAPAAEELPDPGSGASRQAPTRPAPPSQKAAAAPVAPASAVPRGPRRPLRKL
ncbi:MAG TPA: protein kinase [Kofleriaceae bacterium]|jgi:serine/threonine protein kinase|nr:protein kinase [Kofleriaceae bacterium]